MVVKGLKNGRRILECAKQTSLNFVTNSPLSMEKIYCYEAGHFC